MAGKRQRDAAVAKEPDAKKKKSGSSKKKVIEEATEADYKEINRILGFTLNYNHATDHYYGHSAQTAMNLPFAAFPVLTREPPSQGVLPPKLPSGDRGYFLGASDPSAICGAIIEAYKANRPNANMSLAPYRNFDIYLFNRTYYGPDFEKSSGYQDVAVIREELLNSREWGGKEHRLHNPIARTWAQKKYIKMVFLGDFFAEKLPEGLPAGGEFFTAEDLAERRESYNEALKHAAEIAKQKLAKKIESIMDSDSDSESDSE